MMEIFLAVQDFQLLDWIFPNLQNVSHFKILHKIQAYLENGLETHSQDRQDSALFPPMGYSLTSLELLLSNSSASF